MLGAVQAQSEVPQVMEESGHPAEQSSAAVFLHLANSKEYLVFI